MFRKQIPGVAGPLGFPAAGLRPSAVFTAGGHVQDGFVRVMSGVLAFPSVHRSTVCPYTNAKLVTYHSFKIPFHLVELVLFLFLLQDRLACSWSRLYLFMHWKTQCYKDVSSSQNQSTDSLQPT